MAYFPVKGPTVKCKHPHPHNHLHRHDNVYDDGCTKIHCLGQDPTCRQDFCTKDKYHDVPHMHHPHQHCNFDHWDDHYCPYDRYRTYHGHMHIDPCHHDHEIKTTPLYDYDYDRDAYIPNYRGDNGLVLNIDYGLKNTIELAITYENGEELIGEVAEGYKYDFIYADEGVLKRDVGILNDIKVSSIDNTAYDSRLGFSQLSSSTAIYLYFDCSTEGNSHQVTVDINLLRSIQLVEDEDELQFGIVVNGKSYKTYQEALANAKEGDTINGNGTVINDGSDFAITMPLSFVDFVFKDDVAANVTGDLIFYNCTFNESCLNVINVGNTIVSSCQFIANDEEYSSESNTGIRTAIILRTEGEITFVNNVVDTQNGYYNIIETGQSAPISRMTIDNNKFLGEIGHNTISIYNVAEDAVINITNNIFEPYGMRISNYTNSTATFNITNNRYYKVSNANDYAYAGFICLQANTLSSGIVQDFSTYTFNIQDLYYIGKRMAETGEGEFRVWYVYQTETTPTVNFLESNQ